MKETLEILVEFCDNGTIIEYPELTYKGVVEGEWNKLYSVLADDLRDLLENKLSCDKIKIVIEATEIEG